MRGRIDGEVVELGEGTRVDSKRRHEVEVVVDRVVIGNGGRGRLADSVEHCLALGRGVMAAVGVGENSELRIAKSEWGAREGKATPVCGSGVWRFSQHLSCEKCGKSFEELSPHHFSFNGRMGWCAGCEGLGVQRGTSAESVLVDAERTILDGGVAGWEEAGERPVFRAMLTALARAIGFAPGTAVGDLTEGQRHALLFGLGDRWIEAGKSRNVETSKRRNAESDEAGPGAEEEGGSRGVERAAKRQAGSGGRESEEGRGLEEIGARGLRFQWKGFFPAIDEATRVSWQYRMRLESMVSEVACQACGGARLRAESAAARLGDRTIGEVCGMPLVEAAAYFKGLKLDRREAKVAGELLHEIKSRIRFLVDVGLGYLSLGRAAPSLSGGESQRIRLASQLGSGLSGVLYVLDEPTIGLHPRDNQRLVGALKRLRDLGNTLILVEHDREVIEAADHVVDFGPGAGSLGGEVVAAGTPREVRKEARSLTGGYLSGREAIGVPSVRRSGEKVQTSKSRTRDIAAGGQRRPGQEVERGNLADEVGEVERVDSGEDWSEEGGVRAAISRGSRMKRSLVQLSDEPMEEVRGEEGGKTLRVIGARQNNLKNVDVEFPLGKFICVTGVSGSGKSSLVTEILYPALAARLHRARVTAGAHRRIEGLEQVDKIINVDQQAIGTTPQSNAATYCGVFDLVREVFAKLPESKVRGYGANRFSFNRPGGRCDACEGVGQICHAMHFLPDVWVECEACGGTRYQKDTLEVRFKGKHIAEVLEMSVGEALGLFEHVPKVRRILKTLEDVGLGYLPLGQSAPSLSGGEAQRVKLASELARPNTGRTVYVLDEPTTGLHFEDVRKLLNVLHRLVDLGNTVVCIEHNLDVIKTADWVIDLGPEAGDAGGRVVAAGTPEEVARVAGSHTGRLLGAVLERGPRVEREVFDPVAAAAAELAAGRAAAAASRGVKVKMPWERDGKAWHTKGRIGRDGKAAEWEGRALEFVIGLIEKAGGKALRATDWDDPARVEVTGVAPEGVSQGAVPWLCHALTGGRWLIEFYFRVPRGAIGEAELARKLGLRKLDDREDVDAMGSGERVQVRAAHGEMDSVRVSIHDRAEADTAGMRWFVEKAMKAYLGAVRELSRVEAGGRAWGKDGRARHLSQEIMKPGVEKKWKPATLAALVGMMNKVAGGGLKVDWSRKAFVELTRADGGRVAKVITHQAEGLRVDVHVARGALTPTMVEGLGVRQEFGRAGSSGAELTFWVEGLEGVDGGVLARVMGEALRERS